MKKPLRCGTGGAKVRRLQNPRGAPLTADTTTDKRLEEPISAEVVVRERFMGGNGMKRCGRGGIVEWGGGVWVVWR